MKITARLIYALINEPLIPTSPPVQFHDTMPLKGDCIKLHKSQKAVTTVEVIQYGIVDDQHCLIVQCHICKWIDVYRYELSHE